MPEDNLPANNLPQEKSLDFWRADPTVARDNWTQAKSDLATAVTLLDAGIYYAAVFWSQQAAEKSLRAACIERTGSNPRGHDLLACAHALAAPLPVRNAAAALSAEFHRTRSAEYAGGVPAHQYDRPLAAAHLAAARAIVDWTRRLM